MTVKKKTKKSTMKTEAVSRGSFDVTFMVFVLLLLTLGLVMLFSASYAYAYYQKGDSFPLY